MSDKITIQELKNYLGTGLGFKLLYDCHDEFYELEDNEGYQEAFTEGSVWKFVGWSDLELLIGEGEFSGELLQHESGMYMGNYGTHRPLCFRLSDLDKFIPELGFVPIEELFPAWEWDEEQESEQWYVDEELRMKSKTYPSVIAPSLDFWRIQKLFEWHFWIFDQSFFEKGLVLDKMTYGKEGGNED